MSPAIELHVVQAVTLVMAPHSAPPNNTPAYQGNLLSPCPSISRDPGMFRAPRVCQMMTALKKEYDEVLVNQT
jgi:hypothetical protein